MLPLTPADIPSPEEYEHERDVRRRRVLVLQDRRRVEVGEHCSVLFENRETIRYQVLEMIRVERSWDRPHAIEDELQAYNPLIPARGELSATVMFEWESPEERRERLSALVGIDGHVWLVVGGTAPVSARFDRAQMAPGRISAVQFVKWDLDDRREQLLSGDGTVVRLVIDHRHYRAEAVLSEMTRKEIAADVSS